jgi:DNA-binding NtrC family response regulator
MTRAMPFNTVVLAIISNEQDRQALRAMFSQSSWSLTLVATLPEAQAALEQEQVAVVITDDTLGDDRSWRDILQLAESSPSIPVIVSSRTADDHLWTEVLNIGGFDVLSKPFAVKEMFRSVNMAWRDRRDALRCGDPIYLPAMASA